jgi:Flp pilus assembly pilin Flp
MENLLMRIRCLRSCDAGPTATEYATLIAVVVAVVILSMSGVGTASSRLRNGLRGPVEATTDAALGAGAAGNLSSPNALTVTRSGPRK